ncbi:lipopolysaccharide biosynthesis protein [Arthrobacter sp. ISL-69]|uniref:lipopolysaccharide biosynthesis protein n=1 Tax=Arthrobacter sp. ISL-69 TaxID=2819113 RepID=UPI001BEA1B81|nr:lipopolysaccharide biosynthesis protein [Arthrobacter sp. ISL-69]MBT2538267.1 lipopolysaccharide biosynthesis protein [Arthrobacter sp. ISL-69]
MSDRRFGAGSAARGAKATLLGQWLKFAVQLTATVILARLLAPSEFGLFSMIIAFAGLATLLGDFGLSSAAMQAKSLSDQQRSNLFWMNTGIGVLCTVLAFLCAPLIAGFYGQPRLTAAVQTLAPTFVLQAAISQLTANAARSLRFKLLAQVDVTAQLVGFSTALVLATAGAGVTALVAQQLAIALWTLLILSVAGRWVPKLPRRAEMKSLVGFGVNSFLVQLLTYVSSNVDSVLLGRFWGPVPLGLYDRAYQLYRMPIQQIATPLTRVVLPMLSRRQDERAWVSEKLVQIQRIVAYVVGGVFVVLGSMAWSVVGVLLGANWLESAPVLAILALGGVFQSIGYVYYWAFLITNQTGVQLRASIITRSLMVIFIAGGVVFGPIGVAVGVTAGLISNWLILSRWPMRTTGLNVRHLVMAVIRPITIHLLVNLPVALVGAIYVDQLPSLSLLGLQVGIVIVLYGVVFFSYKSFREDLIAIRIILRKAL